MSQPRMRKVSGVGNTMPGVRGSAVKASGDSIPCNLRPKQQNQRSRSKNKLPKSIRYDLENALVGLCDVWFEDIKPHLVRNKIKLHVEADAKGNGGAASGDHEYLPCGAPGCSHLDPGAASDQLQPRPASYVGCCSTLPTALRAPCPKLPVPFPRTPLIPSQNKQSDVEVKAQKGKRSCRKSRQPQSPSPQSNWRVPRLCRTHSVISAAATPRTRTRRAQTAKPSPVEPPCYNDYFQFISSRKRVKTKNKWTQTDAVPQQSKRKVALAQPRAALQFDRCPATTSIISPLRNYYEKLRYRQKADELLDNAFYKKTNDIFGNKKVKKLRVLYKSPVRGDSSSASINTQNEQIGKGTQEPWR